MNDEDSDEIEGTPPPNPMQEIRDHLRKCPTCNKPLPSLSRIPNEVIENVGKLLRAYSDLPNQRAGSALLLFVEERKHKERRR